MYLFFLSCYSISSFSKSFSEGLNLPPPQAFLNFFLNGKSDWETGSEQKGAPSLVIIRFIFAPATGDEAVIERSCHKTSWQMLLIALHWLCFCP